MTKREAKPLRGPVPRHKETIKSSTSTTTLRPRINILGHRPPLRGPTHRYAGHLRQSPPSRPGQSRRRYPLRVNIRSTASAVLPSFRPGMRVTIAVDDISCPAGHDHARHPADHARGFSSRSSTRTGSTTCTSHRARLGASALTPAEMKRMAGKKIYDAFYPDRYYTSTPRIRTACPFWARPPRVSRSHSCNDQIALHAATACYDPLTLGAAQRDEAVRILGVRL